jgi:hypothetical protein
MDASPNGPNTPRSSDGSGSGSDSSFYGADAGTGTYEEPAGARLRRQTASYLPMFTAVLLLLSHHSSSPASHAAAIAQPAATVAPATISAPPPVSLSPVAQASAQTYALPRNLPRRRAESRESQ